MRLKVVCLLMIVFGCLFLYDAITFPTLEKIEATSKKVTVRIKQFARSDANLIFVSNRGEYSIRCDINRALCDSWREIGDASLDLTVVRTSILGGHVAFSSTINGREVRYQKDLEDSLPAAGLKVWFYPIAFFLAFMYYFRQLIRSTQ